MADEDAPVEDTPVEDVPVEGASVEDAPDEKAPDEDGAADTGAQDGGGASGIKSPRGVARVAAVVAGSAVAGAAAIVGAVWAIAVIVDDEDDYRGDCCVVDFATSIDPDGKWGAESDAGPRAYRGDRYERFERDRSEPGEYRQERRDRSEQAKRDKRKKRGDRSGETGREPGESSDSGLALESEECKTILSLGTGDDAVTVLVCNAPGAGWPGFEPGGDGDYFEFRERPRGFRFSPFFGPNGEWPFQDGWAFRDRTPFEDRVPFRNAVPFDLKELYERFFRNGLLFDSQGTEGFEGSEDPFRDGELPFDLGEFFGDGELPFDLEGFFESEQFSGNEPPFDLEEFLEERLDRGDQGFRFRSDGTGDGLCFQLGEEQEACIAGLDQLSDEERAQFEQMLEDFGLEGFLGGLLDSLDGLESEFPESQTDPAG